MTLKNRWVWFGGLALVALFLLSLLAAPRSAHLQQGSTFSRAPSGYGAWYAYMEQQKLPIQQWQRPLHELIKPEQAPVPKGAKQISLPVATQSGLITLVQINQDFGWMAPVDEDWIGRGNALVLVGIKTPVTKAPFRSAINSPLGEIKIETTRRYLLNNAAPQEQQSTQMKLSDSYGGIVWQRPIGKGQVTYIATPHFAANAYQTEPGNIKFLAQLVAEPGYPIFVDEFLHGYKDQTTLSTEKTDTLAGYLAKTPLLLLSMQIGIMLLVLVWGENWRLGAAQPLTEAPVDNSKAYIHALSEVLQKANSRDFVVSTIGKAEQIQLQRALGLGTTPVDPQTVIEAWVQQTGRPATELQDFFQPLSAPGRFSDADLLVWLNKLQIVRRQLE